MVRKKTRGRRLSQISGASATTAVVVLGWRADLDGSASDVMRWRVAEGVAEWRRHEQAVLVVTGGAVANSIAEGPVMAQVARKLGVPDEQLLVDDQAVDTWQNVAMAHELLAVHGTAWAQAQVVLVSDPLHARRGRRYWLAQYPGEQARVSVAVVPKRGPRWYWPIFSFGYEAAVWAADLVRRR